jgi:hypothetical protein
MEAGISWFERGLIGAVSARFGVLTLWPERGGQTPIK